MAVLEVHNIEKHFGATRVLEDISFVWARPGLAKSLLRQLDYAAAA